MSVYVLVLNSTNFVDMYVSEKGIVLMEKMLHIVFEVLKIAIHKPNLTRELPWRTKKMKEIPESARFNLLVVIQDDVNMQ